MDERRFKASTDGAGIGFLVYISSIIVAGAAGWNYFQLPKWLGTVLIPSSIFMQPMADSSMWFGVNFASLLMSLTIYVIIGFIIDWFVSPYK
jgi:hypothetical protein